MTCISTASARRALMAVLVMGTMAVAATAVAQIGEKAVRMVLPNATGSGVDTITRTVQPALAKALGITAARLNEIVRGKRGISADTALRLARYLGTSPDFWLGIQLEYDLRVAQQAKQKDIERVVRPRSEAA